MCFFPDLPEIYQTQSCKKNNILFAGGKAIDL